MVSSETRKSLFYRESLVVSDVVAGGRFPVTCGDAVSIPSQLHWILIPYLLWQPSACEDGKVVCLATALKWKYPFMLDPILAKIFGTKNEREIKAMRPMIAAI